MFRRLFGRAAPPQPDTSAWWHEANALAATPDPERTATLRAQMSDPLEAPDVAECQEEMLEGLEQLQALIEAPALPVVVTQHRVIGNEVCHFLAPASLIGDVDAAGKLFATAARLVFAAGGVRQWPWHAITAVTRVERDAVLGVRGQPEAARLRLNTYGDALQIVALAERLRTNRP
jgi:hypothetical protein